MADPLTEEIQSEGKREQFLRCCELYNATRIMAAFLDNDICPLASDNLSKLIILTTSSRNYDITGTVQKFDHVHNVLHRVKLNVTDFQQKNSQIGTLLSSTYINIEKLAYVEIVNLS